MQIPKKSEDSWIPQHYFDYAPSALVLKQETKSHRGEQCPPRPKRNEPGYDEWDKRTKPLERQVQPATAAETAFRHSGWSDTRQRVERALVRCCVPDARIERFRQCGSGCMVQRQVTTQKLRKSANYCHDRNCKPCAAAKGAAIARNLAKLMAEGEYTHVVLTIKHSDRPLAEQFTHLIESFAKLRRARVWSDRCDAGAYFFECKTTEDRSALHPHLHIVIRSSFIPHADLSKAWKVATGDSSYVWIEAINNKQKAVRYVAKYASKGLDASIYQNDDWLDCCMRALHGRRLCSTFGNWRGVELEDAHGPELPWVNVGWLSSLLRMAREGCVGSAAVVRRLRSWTELHEVDRVPPDGS